MTKPVFHIYAIDRDSFEGEYMRRYSFVEPVGGPVIDRSVGLAVCEDVAVGHAALIEAPEGSRLGTNEAGDDLLLVPGASQGFTATDVFRLTQGFDHGSQYGLRRLLTNPSDPSDPDPRTRPYVGPASLT